MLMYIGGEDQDIGVKPEQLTSLSKVFVEMAVNSFTIDWMGIGSKLLVEKRLFNSLEPTNEHSAQSFII